MAEVKHVYGDLVIGPAGELFNAGWSKNVINLTQGKHEWLCEEPHSARGSVRSDHWIIPVFFHLEFSSSTVKREALHVDVIPSISGRSYLYQPLYNIWYYIGYTPYVYVYILYVQWKVVLTLHLLPDPYSIQTLRVSGALVNIPHTHAFPTIPNRGCR